MALGLAGQQPAPLSAIFEADSPFAAREAEFIDKVGLDRTPIACAELASFYRAVLDEDAVMPRDRKARVIAQGIAIADVALAGDPRSTAALTVKAELRTAQADLETDPARRLALLKESDVLLGVPPMTPGFESVFVRLGPRRLGGAIAPPAKLKHVDPVYPAIAQSARVQGTVVVEAIVDETGHVAAARVLRSIPLLDAAAGAAVAQWAFEPSFVDGRPTPIVMRTIVGFVLK